MSRSPDDTNSAVFARDPPPLVTRSPILTHDAAAAVSASAPTTRRQQLRRLTPLPRRPATDVPAHCSAPDAACLVKLDFWTFSPRLGFEFGDERARDHKEDC